jgi:structure-specific recognition protein 1
MRLYLPTRVRENDNEEEEVSHSAELVKEEILKLANVGSLGESIAVLPEVPLLAPRGKFDLHMLKNVLKIHGPSHDYKIAYKHILKTFLLPKQDGVHIAMVVQLSTPLRQGNTPYPFIVFQFKNGNVRTITLNLPEDEAERKDLFKSEIPSEITGEQFDIVAKLFKAFIGVNIVIPHAFKNAKGASSVRCSLKASEGYLYPLERCLIFIHKPVVYIALEDIKSVECSRIADNNLQRSFDIDIITKKETYQFLGIDRSDYEPLISYFNLKKVKVNSDQGNNIEVLPVSECL